jgi:hypothetical protein
MKRVKQYSFIMMIAATFVLMSPGAAFAYLDPGTGSMILQGIIGGLAAVAVAGKIYWRRIKILLGFKENDSARNVVNMAESSDSGTGNSSVENEKKD